jgi:hypothetical protein
MRKLLLAAAVLLAASVTAYAHHSYAATYDVTREIKLEGKLVQFVYRTPSSTSRRPTTRERRSAGPSSGAARRSSAARA